MFNGILDLIQLITNRLPHPPADIALRDPLARGQVAKGLLSFANTLARFQLMAGHIEHEANYLIRCHERGDFAKRAIENYDTSINNYHQENADLLRALFLAYKVQMLPPYRGTSRHTIWNYLAQADTELLDIFYRDFGLKVQNIHGLIACYDELGALQRRDKPLAVRYIAHTDLPRMNQLVGSVPHHLLLEAFIRRENCLTTFEAGGILQTRTLDVADPEALRLLHDDVVTFIAQAGVAEQQVRVLLRAHFTVADLV